MKELKKPNVITETFDIVNTNCEINECAVFCQNTCYTLTDTGSEEILF